MAVKKIPAGADPQPAPQAMPPGLLDDVIQPLVEHEPAFRSFLRRRVNDTALAEDLLQQSFVRAIERHHALHRNESVVPWFYRILRHAIADYYRSQASDVRKHEAFLHTLTASGEDKAVPPDDVKPTVWPASTSCCPRSGRTMPSSSGASIWKANLRKPWRRHFSSTSATSRSACTERAEPSAPAWKSPAASAANTAA